MRLPGYRKGEAGDIDLPPWAMPRFVTALVLFVTAALLSESLLGVIHSRYEYPIHSWSWWTVKSIRERSISPNIVLLGSSLMVVANAESDATWTGKRIDLTTYRQGRYFDSGLKTSCSNVPSRPLFACKPCSINLASPGQIPSDAYLTMKVALQEGLRPALVVYGVAPRDLFDSTMSSPLDTECFRYCSRLVPVTELIDGLNLTPLEVLDRYWTELPLVRHSLDMQMFLSLQADSVADRMIGQSGVGKISLSDRMLLLKDYEPLDMVPGLIHAEVALRSGVEQQYKDNLDDYAARYRRPRESFYRAQMFGLRKLIALLEKEGVRLVIVNMPVQKANIGLLESGFYSRYLKDLEKTCADSKVAFKNLCDFDQYESSDFRDSVHLNGFGGMRFIVNLNRFVGDVLEQDARIERLAEHQRSLADDRDASY